MPLLTTTQLANARIDNHSKIYHKFWDSELTPDEILNALNERGLANHVLTFASTNITHFAEFAEKAGKTLDDIIDESEWKPRRAFTVNGNEVGLEPPADGYDAWGNLIPVVEEIEDIIDPEVLIEEPDIE